MSKGDWRRPSAVKREDVERNWERIFRAGDKPRPPKPVKAK
jgi:hypothetical protein